jgi:hypothetical protein
MTQKPAPSPALVRDAIAIGGFAALVAGVAWEFSPAWGLIVGGSVLLLLGLITAVRGAP